MDLFSSIERRKSCRSYNMNPLKPEQLAEIEAAIRGFRPLYPSVPLVHRFVKKVKGRFGVQAPHYLVIGGQGAEGEPENAGFLFEQLVLWLDAMELGSVWLGSSKDAEGTGTPGDLIALAFGQTAEPPHRTKEDFKRKPIFEITNAPEDACVQAAHLAPSGMNTQPWYFEKTGDRFLLYRKKLRPPISLLYKLSDLDMGIALCHFALAREQAGKPFSFARQSNLPDKQGFAPFGVIE